MSKNVKVALIYDFDGTLSPGNMQEYSFIKELDMSPSEFWKKADELSKKNDASSILCYMKLMLSEADHKDIPIRRETFTQFGNKVDLFSGVKEWFKLINDYAKTKNIEIKHYINSSGLKEMIEGTSIAKEFEHIYACSFIYNASGVAEWPAVAVDYTTKTQFIFKINKGITEVSDSKKINEYVPENLRPIPFKHMIYFGDGDTDIPSMKMVKQNGGHSIAVYNPKDKNKKKMSEQLILDNRVNFVCPADYSKNKDIYNVVTTIIDKIRSDYDFESIMQEHYQNAQKDR